MDTEGATESVLINKVSIIDQDSVHEAGFDCRTVLHVC